MIADPHDAYQPQARPGRPGVDADVRAWLEHFPPEKRSTIANWFHFSVRAGLTVPAAVLAAVELRAQRSLYRRPDDDVLVLVLERLKADRGAAMTYATGVVEYGPL